MCESIWAYVEAHTLGCRLPGLLCTASQNVVKRGWGRGSIVHELCTSNVPHVLENLFYPHPKTFFSIAFIEEGKEKHWCTREALIGCLPYVHGPGIEPTTQTCALIGNRTLNPSVMGWGSNRLSHTGQGSIYSFITLYWILQDGWYDSYVTDEALKGEERKLSYPRSPRVCMAELAFRPWLGWDRWTGCKAVVHLLS